MLLIQFVSRVVSCTAPNARTRGPSLRTLLRVVFCRQRFLTRRKSPQLWHTRRLEYRESPSSRKIEVCLRHIDEWYYRSSTECYCSVREVLPALRMVHCVAYGCSNQTGKPGVTFHKIPKDCTIRSLWVKSLRRKDWQPSEYSRICSDHFREADIDRTSLSCVRIRNGAVPCIFPSFPSYMQKVPKQRRTLQRSTEQIISSPRCNEEDEQASSSQGVLLKEVPQNPGASLEEPVSLKRRLDTISEANVQYRKKIKVLQQSNRRLKKQNAGLKDIVKALEKKNYLDEENISVLKSVSGVNEELLSRQCAKAKGSPSPRKFGPALRAFALTLNFYSPKAYDYVRATFDTCLPHSRTISKWYQSVNGCPGFTGEAFELLKVKAAANSSEYPLLCTLIMDDMSVRQHIEFDGSRYFGYVDVGSDIESDSLPVAKEVMVFLLVGVNGSWKLPVGYFLISGMNGAQRANLVRKCIVLAESAGVTVISLTCDGAASNLAMATALGCSLIPSALCTAFSVSEKHKSVSLLLDPPHMLKLVRNTLGDKRELLDSDGNIVSWSYMEALHKLQENEGLHLANKLRASHINWVKNKMKVSLATQLFSDSVADALEEASSLGIPGFDGCSATVKFIRIMNRLFDVMNSRSMAQCGWKKPVNVSNYDDIHNFLTEAKQYLLTLKLKCKNELVIHSARKTGFVGFLVCISSVLHLYDLFVQGHVCTPVLKYLPLYKCSQDHLEILFGMIRSRGGWNNNPTAKQFIGAYKKILVKHELRESGKGNCTALEHIPILTVPSTYSAIQCINITTTRKCLLSEETDNDVSHDHDYIPSSDCLTDVSICISTYIAGFVVRHLEAKIHCEVCVSVLRGDGKHPAFSLIRRKSRGGLITPADDVVEVCACAEQVFRYCNKGASHVCPEKSVDFMVSEVLNRCINKPLFKNLSAHMKDQLPLDNHFVLLLKAISKRYLQTRMAHAAKMLNDLAHKNKIRCKYTKLIIFEGQ